MVTVAFFTILALLYVAEARHDRDIEIVQKTGDKKLIQAWHKSDSIFHLTLNILVTFAMFVFVPVMLGSSPLWLSAVVMGITMLGYRQTFMAIPLNVMRKRTPFYLGDTSEFDKKFKNVNLLVYFTGMLLTALGTLYFIL